MRPPLWCELDRVCEEVRDDLAEPTGIDDVRIQQLVEGGFEPDRLPLRRRPQLLDRGLDPSRRLDGQRIDPQLGGGGAMCERSTRSSSSLACARRLDRQGRLPRHLGKALEGLC